MYPMYPLLSLKIPSLGLRDLGVFVTKDSEGTIYHPPGALPGSGVTPESPWKVIKCQVSLQGNKSHENRSQGHLKSCKMDNKIIRSPTSLKADFCNSSLHPDPDPKNIRKNNLETSMSTCTLVQGTTKISKWGPQMLNKNQAWTSKCPFVCSPVSQDRPRAPQDANVKSPSMPNERFGYQKC